MAILNRPSVLNALNTNMGDKLNKLYKCWEDDPDIGFLMTKWSGVLCWWRYCCTLSLDQPRKLASHSQVAILNGITMGGGVGVSIPGTFRIASGRTVFENPETLTGFHPDPGASFYLPHLPGRLGEYLALTWEKLNAAEMMACGLATHYSLSEVSFTGSVSIVIFVFVLFFLYQQRLPLIEEALGILVTDDPSVIEACLEKYCDIVYPD